MKRQIDLKEISDGNLYTAGDMVRADSHDCKGCSACCRGMGDSIVLDPLDICQLSHGLGMDLGKLLEKHVELGIVDGMILPHLAMKGAEEACTFLNEEGRCSIHAFRPGICRLFPLGRYYEGEKFWYFLQVHECKKQDRSKIKVKKWLGIPDLKNYESYILTWHHFLEKCQQEAANLDEKNQRIFQTYLLRMFYQTPYQAEEMEELDFHGFYGEFEKRLEEVKGTLGL